MASDLSDDLIYEMITGSNVSTLKVEEFFNLNSIKLLIKKDKIGWDA